MVISESGLCAAMKAAYKKKSTGYKVASRLSEDGEEEIILSAPDWIAIINRENVPRKVLALIVEHVGDLPAEDKAFQVQDAKVQTEIFAMAVPELSEPVEGATVKRTQLQYNGYQIWQRTDNHNVFMVASKNEELLDNFNRAVSVAENGMFYAEGLVSRLYLKPCRQCRTSLPHFTTWPSCNGYKKRRCPHRPKLGHRLSIQTKRLVLRL